MPGWLLLLPILFAAAPAEAAVRSITATAPRAFGYFIGDVIRRDVVVGADAPFRIVPASLPRPGPVSPWLDLRTVELEDLGTDGAVRRQRVRLEYQIFLAPLEPQPLPVPAFTLTLYDGATGEEARVAGWSVLVSPLRELRPRRDADGPDLRPDAVPRPAALAVRVWAVAGSGGAVGALLAALAWDRAWWPFRRRPGRPFARALKGARAELRIGGAAGLRWALVAFHRAFDATAGRRLLAADVGAFLEAAPAFRPLRADIERFFAASRLVFFAADEAAATDILSGPDLLALGRRLSAAERRAG